MEKIDGTERGFVVSCVFPNNGDIPIVVVGERVDGVMQIVNAFQGEEAKEIFKKLTTRKENKSDVPQ